MGRILLILIAATICWYLLRGMAARNRHVAERREPPVDEIAREMSEEKRPDRTKPEEVREARFRDL